MHEKGCSKFNPLEVAAERGVTAALLNIFDTITASGFTEDPLDVVGRSVVDNLPETNIAGVIREGDDQWRVIAVRPGYHFEPPSVSVARAFADFLRLSVDAEGLFLLTPDDVAPYVPPENRDVWISTTCLGFAVTVAGRQVAIVCLFCSKTLQVTLQRRAWVDLFARVTRSLCVRHYLMCQVENRCEVAESQLKLASAALEEARAHMREHLHALAKTRMRGKATAADCDRLIRNALANAEETLGYADVLLRREGKSVFELRDAAFANWVRQGLNSTKVKVLVGLRGTAKSNHLRTLREWLVRSAGVSPARVVMLDCEDAHFRQFKSADDIVEYLREIPLEPSGPNYLLLDEIGRIVWHAELLERLQSLADWNVWVASSTAHALRRDGSDPYAGLLVYRVWTDPDQPRTLNTLERIWCQILMRDVICVSYHPDIRAIEALAEYCSDHLGEAPSSRDVSRELSVDGRHLSPNTILAYYKTLVDAYLIEEAPYYDSFEQRVLTGKPGTVFFTDLELRLWRFGPAPEREPERVELNRLYLRLRRTYERVYVPNDGSADFITLDPDGTERTWSR